MASISITYTWAENQSLAVDIYAEDSFPDALDQCRAEAVRAMRESLADVCGIETRAGDLPDAP